MYQLCYRSEALVNTSARALVNLRRAGTRLRLWQGMLLHTGRLDPDVDLSALAAAHAPSGGAIANAVRAAALVALQRGQQTLQTRDLLYGIGKELRNDLAIT